MHSGNELRKLFLEFFRERGHAVVPSSSLVPDDPSVLLTTAGMQQFKPYFTGKLDPEKDFGSKNTASVQKSFRTSDIDEVGDESHLTFFEMLGNFSFGGYFKEEAIAYGHEFITKTLGLEIAYVSVFEGDDEVPADKQSEEIWKSLGVEDVRKFGREDNFWGPTGSEGPCGPTTEIYVNTVEGKGVEIWNIVFNEYYRHPDGRFEKLDTPGVDTGMGLERLAMVSQGVRTIFDTDLFREILEKLPPSLGSRTARVLTDHVRSVVFLLSDGVTPSNKEAGYVLRRLMRRIIVHAYLGKKKGEYEISAEELLKTVVVKYREAYPSLDKDLVLREFQAEEGRFETTLENGIREMKKMDEIDNASGFNLYETFGIPYEVIREIGDSKTEKMDREGFEEEFTKHQEISRAGAEEKFGGHGLVLDTGELKAEDEESLKKVTRLHTATHILQQALRDVLGDKVAQRGSDITPKRTRFDFSFDRKLTPEELAEAERIVNEKIKEDLPVNSVELPKDEAEKTGALHFFKAKYPDPVTVYFVGSSLEKAFSKEFCGGPHVSRTGEIGEFKILKEESSSAGIRRIRGTVSP